MVLIGSPRVGLRYQPLINNQRFKEIHRIFYIVQPRSMRIFVAPFARFARAQILSLNRPSSNGLYDGTKILSKKPSGARFLNHIALAV
jgi:hypothetical protein